MDCVGSGAWGPIGRDPALPGGAAAASSHAQVGATTGPTVYRSGCRLPDAPSGRRPLGVVGEEECPDGLG